MKVTSMQIIRIGADVHTRARRDVLDDDGTNFSCVLIRDYSLGNCTFHAAFVCTILPCITRRSFPFGRGHIMYTSERPSATLYSSFLCVPQPA